MAPIVLKTDVHCYDCAKKIRDTIKNLLGVEEVWASPETGLVIVAGTADAVVLRRRIKQSMRRSVTIVSDGMEEDLPDHHHYCGMTHMAPEGHPHYYFWGTTTPRRRHQYAPPPPPPCCAYPHHRYSPMPAGCPYQYGGRYSPVPPPHHHYAPPPAGNPYPYPYPYVANDAF